MADLGAAAHCRPDRVFTPHNLALLTSAEFVYIEVRGRWVRFRRRVVFRGWWSVGGGRWAVGGERWAVSGERWVVSGGR